MISKTLPVLAAVGGLFAAPIFADGHSAPALTVEEPYAFSTPVGVPVGSGYLSITNSSDRSVVLLSVEADFPRVMIHESVMVDGVMQMEHRMSVEIPAGQTLSFEPGGLHIMFMGLEEPLEAGDTIPVTLVFQDLSPLQTTFTVKERE